MPPRLRICIGRVKASTRNRREDGDVELVEDTALVRTRRADARDPLGDQLGVRPLDRLVNRRT
jgi:hypothetical protein